MRAEFNGTVTAIRPSGIANANGDAVFYNATVSRGGGNDLDVVFSVPRSEAASWAGRKVRVTVETLDHKEGDPE